MSWKLIVQVNIQHKFRLFVKWKALYLLLQTLRYISKPFTWDCHTLKSPPVIYILNFLNNPASHVDNVKSQRSALANP